jgi:hypothetical protein
MQYSTKEWQFLLLVFLSQAVAKSTLCISSTTCCQEGECRCNLLRYPTPDVLGFDLNPSRAQMWLHATRMPLLDKWYKCVSQIQQSEPTSSYSCIHAYSKTSGLHLSGS